MLLRCECGNIYRVEEVTGHLMPGLHGSPNCYVYDDEYSSDGDDHDSDKDSGEAATDDGFANDEMSEDDLYGLSDYNMSDNEMIVDSMTVDEMTNGDMSVGNTTSANASDTRDTEAEVSQAHQSIPNFGLAEAGITSPRVEDTSDEGSVILVASHQSTTSDEGSVTLAASPQSTTSTEGSVAESDEETAFHQRMTDQGYVRVGVDEAYRRMTLAEFNATRQGPGSRRQYRSPHGWVAYVPRNQAVPNVPEPE